MRRDDVKGLHYIPPLSHVPSILQQGLRSHNCAKKRVHHSVAMPEIQEGRAQKVVPRGRPLRDYVNLCFHARNPMLFQRRAEPPNLCVLQVSVDVLDWPGVVITDGNAAGDDTAFFPSPAGLERLSRDAVFAEWWTDPNDSVKWEKTRRKCAEILVPDRIAADPIIGAYVSCNPVRRHAVETEAAASRE